MARTDRRRPLSEFEEIVGYHLEHAYRYHDELGPVDEAGRTLAKRASERLFSAADRAGKQRGDYPAAENLLSRALRLRPEGDAYRAEILLRLSWTRFNHGDLEGDASRVREAIDAAVAAGEAGLEWRARLREATVNMWRGAPTDDLVRVATSALEVFDEIGYDRGAQAAWGSLQIAYSWRGRFAAALDALDRCHEYRRRAGEPHHDGDFAYLAGALLFGATPVEEAIARVEDLLRETDSDFMQGLLMPTLGWLEAMAGRFDRARELCRKAKALHEAPSKRWLWGQQSNFAGSVELLAGRPDEAERILRQGYVLLGEIQDSPTQSSAAGGLAEALYRQGRYDEAEDFARVCEELSHADDVEACSHTRAVQGKVAARRGKFAEGERHARAAVELLDQTDMLSWQGDARLALAEVLQLAGRQTEAMPALEHAIDLYIRKGNVVSAGKARSLLQELTVA